MRDERTTRDYLRHKIWVSFTDSPSYFVSDFLGGNKTVSDT